MKYLTIRILIFFLFLLILVSCSEKQPVREAIIGEWKFARSIYKYENGPVEEIWINGVSGYVFHENGYCENKQAYIRRNKNKEMVYYGNETKYKIENDSLKIYNPSDTTWNSRKIISIEADTLTLEAKDIIFKYYRPQYFLDPAETYDKITLSSSGCLGSCPIAEVSIDKEGNVFFRGKMYNTRNGLYSAKITKDEYKEIEEDFKKAGIMSLKDLYSADWTDDEEITISFYKNNKVVKTIKDYGGQAPSELIWAYTKLRFLYQIIELTPLKEDDKPIEAER
ncbi:MAG: DUF6438 domain-containing protein [Flavobacteriales bacterium]